MFKTFTWKDFHGGFMRVGLGAARCHRFPKKTIVDALGQLLITSDLEVENEPIARLSLHAYKNGAADYADYVIGFSNKTSGCDVTYTFDHNFADSRIAQLL